MPSVDMSQPTFDPEHLVDMILFGVVGGLFWTLASIWEQPWFLLIGAPFIVMFIVSVWRVIR